MLSKTIQNMVPSGTLEINARVFELKESGVPIINLSVGEPDFNTPEAAKEGAAWAMKENKTRYDKAAGLIEPEPVRVSISDLAEWLFGAVPFDELVRIGSITGPEDSLNILRLVKPLQHIFVREEF